MTTVKITLISAGVVALLRGPEAQADLLRRGKAIAEVAGPGMVASLSIGANRARVSIRTESEAAMHAEATTRALTNAIDAGRG